MITENLFSGQTYGIKEDIETFPCGYYSKLTNEEKEEIKLRVLKKSESIVEKLKDKYEFIQDEHNEYHFTPRDSWDFIFPTETTDINKAISVLVSTYYDYDVTSQEFKALLETPELLVICNKLKVNIDDIVHIHDK